MRTNESNFQELHVTRWPSTFCQDQTLNFFGNIMLYPRNSLAKLLVLGQVEGKQTKGTNNMLRYYKEKSWRQYPTGGPPRSGRTFMEILAYVCSRSSVMRERQRRKINFVINNK